MQTDLDVNPAFVAWRLSTASQKDQTLQELVQRMEKYATAICWQRLPDHSDELGALVNGIVWRAIKQADKFVNRSKFSTWFYTIIVNECNRYLRNYKKRCETNLDEMPAKQEGMDAKIDLIALLDGLSAPDHALVRMVGEGEDFKTIAKELGISYVAARVRWNRLKEKLQDAIQS